MPAPFRSSAPPSALVVVVAILAGCGGADARRTSHMARGEQYLAADELAKARIEFADALQIAPNDAEARFMSGRVAERLGNLRTAASMYQGAIDVDPGHVQAHARLGLLYVLSGAPDRALQLIKPVLESHPDDSDLLSVRAAARALLKDDAGALADAQRAVQLSPGNEGAVSLLAGLYKRSGQVPRAVELLGTTLHKVPGSVELHEALASLYISQGDSPHAEVELLQIVQLKPRQLLPRLQLASFYVSMKRLDDAERTLRTAMASLASDAAKLAYVDFLTTFRSRAQGEAALRQLIAQEPHNYDLQLGLGALQQRVGATQDAVRTFRAIIAQDRDGPASVGARDRIAAIDATSGNYREALTLIDAALDRNPRDTDALTLRGNIRLEQGDALGAIADLRAVLRDQPTAVPILRALARAHLANHEPALAEENLRNAVANSPADVQTRVDLAQLLARTRRGPEAITLLEDTVKATPGAAGTPARTALVLAYLAKPDLPAARTAAEEVEDSQPQLAIGPHLSGVVAQAQGRAEDAQRKFEHALQLQPYETDALTALARLELRRGQDAQAIALARDATDHAPANAPAHNLLGELYLADKHYPEAVSALGTAVRLAPTWWVPYRNLGQAKSGSGDSAGALATYQAGVQATGEPALVAELASLYERAGRIDEAIRQYEALHERSPHLELAANNLAMLLVTYRKDKASLDRARDLTAPFANSDVAALLDTYGWVLFRRGDALQALSALVRASEQAPDSKVIRYHLAMAELQAGQHERARADLESALAGAASFQGSEEARRVLASLTPRSSG
jgi:tetratricopeptide (TPR) repeat protein